MKMLFYSYERDGLIYVNPLPACHSACWWQNVLAKIGRYFVQPPDITASRSS